MDRAVRWHDYITINAYWFALTTRAQVLSPLVVPLLVQRFVGEQAKGAYFGLIRLWALMAAVLFQALMGLLSDRSTFRWGRRRPFVVIGTLGEVAVLVLIGFAANLQGMTGFWVLLPLYTFSMATSNTAHAAAQSLIPDLVPEDQRGRFSGIKVLLELPIPLIFVSFVVSRLVSAGNLWGTVYVLIAVLVGCMLVTLLVRERPPERAPAPLEWRSLLRLVAMTGAFALIILGIGAIVPVVLRQLHDLAPAAAPISTAIVGVIGMGIAVALGVWLSVRISIGSDSRENPSFTWWVVNRLAFLVAANSLSGFMIYYLQERFEGFRGELAAGPTARVMMAVGICLLLAALPSGWLADRFGKKRLIAISGVLAAVGLSVVLLVPLLGAIYVGGCLIGTAIGVFYSASWALGADIVPREEAGRYLGLANLAGAGAGAIGAYIGGPIADHSGYGPLFAIYGAFFLLSALALPGIRERGAPQLP
ncbi:MAG: MFS transporter [Anaerolineae bacterium]|nr:MFS transporter [Anaerolineae bacterium]